MADADPIPTTRISRSLVGRLIAVGLFLVVGTVAVIHTVNRRVPQPTELAANASKSEPGDEAKTESVAQSVEHAPATSLPPPAMNTSGGTSSLKVAVTGGEETETGDYPPRIAASGINAGAGKPPVLGQATLQATRQATNATGAATPLNPLVHSTTSQEPPGSLQEPGGAPDKQPPPIVRGSITVEPETEAPGEPSNLATTGSAAPRAFPTPPAILSGSGARPPATGGSTSMALGDAPPLVAGKTASPPLVSRSVRMLLREPIRWPDRVQIVPKRRGPKTE